MVFIKKILGLLLCWAFCVQASEKDKISPTKSVTFEKTKSPHQLIARSISSSTSINGDIRMRSVPEEGLESDDSESGARKPFVVTVDTDYEAFTAHRSKKTHSRNPSAASEGEEWIINTIKESGVSDTPNTRAELRRVAVEHRERDQRQKKMFSDVLKSPRGNVGIDGSPSQEQYFEDNLSHHAHLRTGSIAAQEDCARVDWLEQPLVPKAVHTPDTEKYLRRLKGAISQISKPLRTALKDETLVRASTRKALAPLYRQHHVRDGFPKHKELSDLEDQAFEHELAQAEALGCCDSRGCDCCSKLSCVIL